MGCEIFTSTSKFWKEFNFPYQERLLFRMRSSDRPWCGYGIHNESLCRLQIYDEASTTIGLKIILALVLLMKVHEYICPPNNVYS